MSNVAAWTSSTKSNKLFFRRVVFYTLLGVTFIIGVLVSSESTSLGTVLSWLLYGQDVNTQPRKSAEAALRLRLGASNILRADSLRWRVQNQTQFNGRSRWELDDNGWHPRRIDVSEFLEVEPIQPGRLELVKHPVFGNMPVLIKIADTHEAMMYRLLYDRAITPLFLGHVTQNDQMVGFITEFVQRQEETTPTTGTRRRREACLAALRRMHTKGVAHQDAHGENCLLRSDGSAALIDFELSTETSSRADFDRDLWIMYHTVAD